MKDDMQMWDYAKIMDLYPNKTAFNIIYVFRYHSLFKLVLADYHYYQYTAPPRSLPIVSGLTCCDLYLFRFMFW